MSDVSDTNNPIELSIIIITFNSLPSLEPSLVSLTNSSFQNFELIVVDNNSTDSSIETALTYFPQASVIKNKYNAGFAKACNIGAKQANGDILLFFNPDLEADENALDEIVTFIQETPDAGAVSGRMRFPDGSFQATSRKFPDMTNIFLSRGSALSKIISTNKTYTLPDYDVVTKVDAVAGTCMAVKRNMFEQVGMFDERFFMYMEDTDLSYRLSLLGLSNYFLPQAGGVHLWGKGSSGGRIIRSWYHHLSVWKYFLKHFPGGFSILFLPFILTMNFIISIFLPKR